MSTLRSVLLGSLPLAVILAACLVQLPAASVWGQSAPSTGGPESPSSSQGTPSPVLSLPASTPPSTDSSHLNNGIIKRKRYFWTGVGLLTASIPFLGFGGRAMLIDKTCVDPSPCAQIYETNRTGIGLSLTGAVVGAVGVVLVVIGMVPYRVKAKP